MPRKVANSSGLKEEETAGLQLKICINLSVRKKVNKLEATRKGYCIILWNDRYSNRRIQMVARRQTKERKDTTKTSTKSSFMLFISKRGKRFLELTSKDNLAPKIDLNEITI